MPLIKVSILGWQSFKEIQKPTSLGAMTDDTFYLIFISLLWELQLLIDSRQSYLLQLLADLTQHKLPFNIYLQFHEPIIHK